MREAKTVSPEDKKLKVLYIAGWGRSGSTILGGILGQIKGFSLVGEIRHVWDQGLIHNSLCSCGAPFRECPLWREVLFQAFGGIDCVEPCKLSGFLDTGLRTKHFLLPPPFQSPRDRVDRMQDYTEALSKLYRAVRHVTQSDVLVDTSKVPAYGYVLDNIDEVELYVLHLVRDPRATAYSWGSRRKLQLESDGQSKPMVAHGSFYSSLAWSEWNFVIERIWRHSPERYLLMRYEDFVRNPRSAVRDILELLGHEGAELPFTGGREVSLGGSHVFSGNPNRFDSGSVTIKVDEEWKKKVSGSQRALVTSLTWPGLIRYGYPTLGHRLKESTGNETENARSLSS